MKICVIGDIHGRSNWQKIDLEQYDKVVFMGDYFDPYAYNISYDDRWDNFQKILELKKKDPFKVILLFGNHDFHYLPNIREKYSRYDNTMALDPKFRVGETFEKLLHDDVLLLGYTVPGTRLFFSHATISIPWYNRFILGKTKSEIEEAPVLAVPDLEEARVRLEVVMNRIPIESYAFTDAYWDVYGYDPSNSPLWWRCMNQYGDGLQVENILKGLIQVNGHTQMRELRSQYIGEDSAVVLVDILEQNKYTEINVSDEGISFIEKSLWVS